MSVIITNNASTIEFLYSDNEEFQLNKTTLNIKKGRRFVYITNSDGFVKTPDNEVIKIRYTEVTSPVVADNDELVEILLGYKASSGVAIGDVRVTDGTNILSIEENGSMPVTIQDQTTPVVIVPLSKLEQSTTVAIASAIGDDQTTLTSVVGVSDKKLLTFFCPESLRFMIARAVGSPVGNVVTLDRYFDFAFDVGCYVDISDTNMAVNGSVTPVVFGVRNNAGVTPPPGVDVTMDVTRLLFQCITTDLPELNMFGDIAGGLNSGLFCRRRDGDYRNIFNAQTNGELAGIMYDINIYEAAKFGVNGFAGRLTFAGQNKLGVTVRLAINEDLEIIVKDDLSSLGRLSIVAEGSLVRN